MTIDDIFDNLPTLETPRLLLWEGSAVEIGRFLRSLPPAERAAISDPGNGAAATRSARFDQLGVHHLPRWCMVHKETDEMIGCCGFITWHLRHARAELACALAPGYRRRGYMSEALKTVLGFGFRVMQLNRIEASCSPGNAAAIALFRSSGMREEMLLRGYLPPAGDPAGGDRSLFSMLRTEWK